MSNDLASAYEGIMSSKANSSINFQSRFTNEVSKYRLLFYLSFDFWFLDLSYFRGDISFSKLVDIFGTLCLTKEGTIASSIREKLK